jgi:hypothetical protein
MPNGVTRSIHVSWKSHKKTNSIWHEIDGFGSSAVIITHVEYWWSFDKNIIYEF